MHQIKSKVSKLVIASLLVAFGVGLGLIFASQTAQSGANCIKLHPQGHYGLVCAGTFTLMANTGFKISDVRKSGKYFLYLTVIGE